MNNNILDIFAPYLGFIFGAITIIINLIFIIKVKNLWSILIVNVIVTVLMNWLGFGQYDILSNLLRSIVDIVFTFIGDLLARLFDIIAQGIGNIVGGGFDWLNQLLEGIVNGVSDLINGIWNIFS